MISYRCYVSWADLELLFIYDCTKKNALAVGKLVSELFADAKISTEVENAIREEEYNVMLSWGDVARGCYAVAVKRCTTAGYFLSLVAKATDECVGFFGIDRSNSVEAVRRAVFDWGQKEIIATLKKIESLF